MTISIPIKDNGYINLDVDVVQPDFHVLIGLGVLDLQQLVADNVENCLESSLYGSSILIIIHYGHIYNTCDTTKIVFTRLEILRMH